MPTSVVPQPISISVTPISRSASVSTASPAATGCSTSESMPIPARSTQRTRLFTDVIAPDTMVVCTSMRCPSMAIGLTDGYDALAGLGADVRARDADEGADNLEARLLLRLADGAHDRLDDFL